MTYESLDTSARPSGQVRVEIPAQMHLETSPKVAQLAVSSPLRTITAVASAMRLTKCIADGNDSKVYCLIVLTYHSDNCTYRSSSTSTYKSMLNLNLNK